MDNAFTSQVGGGATVLREAGVDLPVELLADAALDFALDGVGLALDVAVAAACAGLELAEPCAAFVPSPSDRTACTVSTTSTSNAIAAASSTKRRRQYTAGGCGP